MVEIQIHVSAPSVNHDWIGYGAGEGGANARAIVDVASLPDASMAVTLRIISDASFLSSPSSYLYSYFRLRIYRNTNGKAREKVGTWVF